MAKLIYSTIASLDGYIADEDENLRLGRTMTRLALSCAKREAALDIDRAGDRHCLDRCYRSPLHR